MEKVPFLDLSPQHLPLQDEIFRALGDVFRRQWYVMGQEVEAFEKEFAAYSGTSHCIGVGNGLDALTLSLKALNIGAGDRVVVPAHTFVATACAVAWAGAQVTLADVDADTGNLTASHLEAAVAPSVRAVLPVHLYGQICEMEDLMAVARRSGLWVVEDNAQSQGAHYAGRASGSWGDLAGTSFYPGKNLGALGDGGAVLCSDEALCRQIRLLRNYGSETKYEHEVIGINSRLDEIQAAVLRLKLRDLDRNNQARQRLASIYLAGLKAVAEVQLPRTAARAQHVYHLFVIRSHERTALRAAMSQQGIETLIHYPIPVHLQKAFSHLGYRAGQFPNSEDWARRAMSLPLYPGLEAEAQLRVINGIRNFYGYKSLQLGDLWLSELLSSPAVPALSEAVLSDSP